MSQPLYLAPFTAVFEDEGTPDEVMKIQWEDGGTKEEAFQVGLTCLLDDISNLSSVPQEQLEASIRMAAILATGGEQGLLPGTTEYNEKMGVNQDTKYFQTIIGNAKLKEVNISTQTPAGKMWELIFQKVGAASNTKTFTTDAVTLSHYSNGLNAYYFAAKCVPGAIFKEFGSGYKKSTLDSDKRQDIIDFVALQHFWI